MVLFGIDHFSEGGRSAVVGRQCAVFISRDDPTLHTFSFPPSSILKYRWPRAKLIYPHADDQLEQFDHTLVAVPWLRGVCEMVRHVQAKGCV